MSEFDKLMKVIPSLKHADTVTIKGPVIFDKEVQIIGNVTITNHSSTPKRVPNQKIENEQIVI